MNSNIEKLINTARAEVGYLEKKSNSNLYDKTANAGSNNYTKYAYELDKMGDIYNGAKNGYAWCDIFVDWCFITCFGKELGMKLLCQAYKGAGAGCTYSAQYFKNKNQFYKSPQPGDQIFFTNDGGKTSNHTGLVVAVDSSKVYTIEGNTSSAAGVVANGGCVREKSYSLSYGNIYGYGRPNWSLIPEQKPEPKPEPTPTPTPEPKPEPKPETPNTNNSKEEQLEVRYNTINDVPASYKESVKKLIDKGILKGRDEKGTIDISEDMARIITMLDRAGKWN